MLVHATALDVSGAGLLVVGAPGAGKSDLALRLIRDGALLVSDDQADVMAVGGRLHASAAPNISGLLEVRGAGIVRVPLKASTWLRLAIEPAGHDETERMPRPRSWSLPGTETPGIPLFRLQVFEVSAPAKVRILLHSGVNP